MVGRIPKQFIDELLTRSDIVDVIDARVPLRKAGKDYKACCPFHEEKTPSFTVSADKQFYHCFGCGAHGSVIGFLMEYDHMSFVEAVEELAARAGLAIPREAGAVSGEVRDNGSNLLGLMREATRFYRQQLREHPQSNRAVEYLKRRGITGEIAHEFGLGFAPDGWDNLLRALGNEAATREALARAGLAVKKEGGGYYDRFRDRIMFPIEDHRGRIVAFGGRVIDKGEPKYLNSPETPLFHKGRELYGLYHARDAIKRENRVLVVEGYMDVVALAQYGINNAVATLGTATTREHLDRLFRHAPEVIFCFDGDRAGREAAWRALDNALAVLREGRQVSFLFLPEGEDPDTLVRKEGRAALLARIKAAIPLPDYLFSSLSQQVDLNRLDGRARLVELARPLLSKMPTGVLRQMMLDRLAELSRIDPERLMVSFGNPENTSASNSVNRPLSGKRREPPSVVRLAIAMLLQQPSLADQVPDDPGLAELDLPGMNLFLAVLQVLESTPRINTALIVESFRDSEHQHNIAKLAVWQHPVLDQNVETEFTGLMQRLREISATQRIERLLQRQRSGEANQAEKAELARLLTQKKETTRPFPSRH
ncbi:MAG TPA: DNA primase [Candidatus Methylomirabilis sp.]|nr:DNA primase [Candidatus Methylomirabilis sp.]